MTPTPLQIQAPAPVKQHKHTNTNPFKQPVMSSQRITRSSSRKVTRAHRSARGESLDSGFPLFATWMLPLKVPGVPHVRGTMKIPAKMAEQRSGVNPSPPAPLSRHFDVMAALCFVMCVCVCGGAVRLAGPSRLCLLVCWA